MTTSSRSSSKSKHSHCDSVGNAPPPVICTDVAKPSVGSSTFSRLETEEEGDTPDHPPLRGLNETESKTAASEWKRNAAISFLTGILFEKEKPKVPERETSFLLSPVPVRQSAIKVLNPNPNDPRPPSRIRSPSRPKNFEGWTKWDSFAMKKAANLS